MASYIKASLERAYAETFLADLESNTNQYFLFVGKGIGWEDGSSDTNPPAYTDTVSSEYSVMNQAIGYKKISPQNVIFALPRNDWFSGVTYDQYDDNVELRTKKYYVVTDENHIYKCLNNSSGASSRVKPTLVSSSPFTLSDGYTWKYLATVKESNLPYELTDYVPIEYVTDDRDTETQNQYNTQVTAVSGNIDRMILTYPTGIPGASFGVYPNTWTTTRTAPAFGIEVSKITKISPTRKTVMVSEITSKSLLQSGGLSINNYVNYIMRVVFSQSNPTEINNYGVIVGASVVGSNNDIQFIIENDVVDFNFTDTGTPVKVEILPYVKIIGNGSGSYVFPVMNTKNNIASINVVNGGRNYSSCLVQPISYKTPVTVHPTVRTVLSPKGGHGSNVLKELGVKDVLVIIEISEEDSEKIQGGGKYRQFGIVKNPVLNDGTYVIAGKQEDSYRDIELLPVYGSTDPSHFDVSQYNFIIGSESFASSKIVSVKSIDTNSVLVKTLNKSGNYISRLDRPNDYLIAVDTDDRTDAVQSFQTGEIVTQVVPANTPFGTGSLSFGFDYTVTGIIVAKYSNSIAVRVLSNGNFVTSSTIKMIGKTSNTMANVLSVTPRYGEEVWISNNQNGLAAFVANNDGDQTLYKIVNVGPGYFDLDTTPSYSGLHVLDISSSLSPQTGGLDTTTLPLTQTTFANGDTVDQGSMSQFGHYATGTVYKWDYVNPAFGKLYLTNVIGSFKSVAKDGISGSQLQQYIVADVTLPEIQPTSGEVIYINNVRPIDRIEGQQEEYRIRLGF